MGVILRVNPIEEIIPLCQRPAVDFVCRVAFIIAAVQRAHHAVYIGVFPLLDKAAIFQRTGAVYGAHLLHGILFPANAVEKAAELLHIG